jgi:hypothetical protein
MTGFRDINMNLTLPSGHIAELQVHHKAIVEFESHQHSHEHYEVRDSVPG